MHGDVTFLGRLGLSVFFLIKHLVMCSNCARNNPIQCVLMIIVGSVLTVRCMLTSSAE